ncbi:MAG: S8 family serine peptidase, partial [Cyanobacteria bacterium]|nr:S8 family serine peptidase [Cyanobacteriota bacterium]
FPSCLIPFWTSYPPSGKCPRNRINAIGHLDTGVDGRHPAFKKAIGGFAFFELSMGQRRRPDPAPFDSGDHGTHTAGTITGRPIKGRSFGVAPGASLYSALVIEGGNVVARVLGGLDWAIASRVKIVSMSFGFRGWWEDFIPIVQVLRSRGILPVIAVGNEGPGTSRSPGNYVTALSVGAMDEANRVAAFSSSQQFDRPDDTVVPDLVAPGVDVVSAAPGKSYQSMSGSSMATPHIAGLAALLWEAKPAATAADIERAIFDSCRRAGSMSPQRANRGVPDAAAAFSRLTGQRLGAVPTGRRTPGRRGAASTSRKRTATKRRK